MGGKLADEYKFEGQVGEQRRFSHSECNDTRDRLYVKRTAKGWLFHCHNCAGNCSGFCYSNSKSLSPSRTLKRYEETKQGSIEEKQAQEQIYNSVSLPYDFTTEIPYKGVIWLDKYNISEQLIIKYNLGYSKILDRLILPVYNDAKEVIFWQGRNLGIIDKYNPKYKNCRIPGKTVYLDTAIIDNSYTNLTEIIIVEDILSAMKIGEYRRTIALLGSYISDSTLDTLKEFSYIKIWLDADKYLTAVKYATRIRQVLNKIVTVIYSIKDPKEYSESALLSYLY